MEVDMEQESSEKEQPARKRTLTIEEAQNSIYIDFEGEGASQGNPNPRPHMLGAYWPKRPGKNSKYHAYLFRSEWKPVSNGNCRRASIGAMEKVLIELFEEVKRRGGYLVHWSIHEYSVLKEHYPELVSRYDRTLFNAKPPIDRMINSRKDVKEGMKRPEHLYQYVDLLMKNNQQIASIKPGAAESCRRIDKYCDKRWGSWTDSQKQIANNLLDYNKSDCEYTWKLTKKLANHLDAKIKADGKD